jgi:hypothetical protein
MKRIILIVFVWVFSLRLWGQTVEIHQIDVGAGDATLIKVNTRVPPYAILLDAGTKSNGADVIAYLSDTSSGDLGANPYLDLVITSHFHDDHMGGLVGRSSSDDRTDCASFSGVLGSASGVRFCAVLDKGNVEPVPSTIVYEDYCTLSAKDARRVQVGAKAPAGVAQYTLPAPADPAPAPPFAATPLQLGGIISLGADERGTEVTLRLIAADGNVYAPNVAGGYVDVAQGSGVDRKNPGAFANANNWGVGFILEYGQFRYYTGGDFGGYKVGAYLDLESPIANSLPSYVTTPGSEGHICAFKLDHHGSRESTNDLLINTMKPTVASISCGDRHDHPNQEALDRLQEAKWTKTNYLLNDGLRKYVMTELRLPRSIFASIGITSGNIGYVAPPYLMGPSKTIVKKRTVMPPSAKPQIQLRALYELNILDQVAGDFVIKVFDENNADQPIGDLSSFSLTVAGFDKTQSFNIGSFNCHKK